MAVAAAEDELQTRVEALQFLRVKKDFLYSPEGRTLPVVRLGGRLMVRRGALTEWLRARERPMAAAR